MMQELHNPAIISPVNTSVIALAAYLIRTLATYLLEGRLYILITEDPIGCPIYAVVANILTPSSSRHTGSSSLSPQSPSLSL